MCGLLSPGSFAVASVLTSLALVTLFAKISLERKTRRELEEASRSGAVEDATPEPTNQNDPASFATGLAV